MVLQRRARLVRCRSRRTLALLTFDGVTKRPTRPSVANAGHTGPLCNVCLDDNQHFHEGRCNDCPETGSGIALVVGLLFGSAGI
eukprot:3311005-Prymnesium_polylepis.1